MYYTSAQPVDKVKKLSQQALILCKIVAELKIGVAAL